MVDRLRASLGKRGWNGVVLLLALTAVLLMVVAVASVDSSSRPTGDELHLTAAPSTLHRSRRQAEGRLQRGEPSGPAELQADRERLGATPLQVHVGLYAMNNYGLDLQVPSFHSTGYVWFKWDQAVQDYFQQRGLTLWKVITPVNLLDIPQASDTVFQPIGEDKPIRMADGSYYQIVSYKGEFFVDRADFTQHPFTRVSLPIMLEADDINLSYGMLRLLPDLGGSGIGEFIASNNGWVDTGWTMAEYRHRYATDFGFGAGASDYSQLVYQVEYRTSAWHSFWKLLIPLLIVMAMVVGATKLDPAQWEVRLTLPVTVLLTLVFLQQGYSAELPKLPYLTFIDEIYVVAYSLTLGSFGLMLWGCRRYYRALQIESEPERLDALRRLDLSDDAWPAAVILVGMVAVAICWFTA